MCVATISRRMQCTHCNALQHLARVVISFALCLCVVHTRQHTATRRNALQRAATRCNTLGYDTLQHTATHGNTLQLTATHCTCHAHVHHPSMRRTHAATHCDALQHARLRYTATHCDTLQHTANVIIPSVLTFCVRCVLQYTAKHWTTTHCNTLHHTATHCTCHRPFRPFLRVTCMLQHDSFICVI